jgi:hypothetical protein
MRIIHGLETNAGPRRESSKTDTDYDTHTSGSAPGARAMCGDLASVQPKNARLVLVAEHTDGRRKVVFRLPRNNNLYLTDSFCASKKSRFFSADHNRKIP